MQEQVNEKTVALYIKTGKLTAEMLQRAMKKLLSQMKKQADRPPHGKQTLKQLMKQNAGVSNIEITGENIKAFESTAKKYHIDFALKKDTTETPPRYLVFFKGRDADVLTAAFQEFSAKKLTQDKRHQSETSSLILGKRRQHRTCSGNRSKTKTGGVNDEQPKSEKMDYPKSALYPLCVSL